MADILLDQDSQFLRDLGDGRRVFTTSDADLANIRTYFMTRGAPSGTGDPEDIVFFRANGLNPGSWANTLIFTIAANNDIQCLSGWFDNWTPDPELNDTIHVAYVHNDGGGLHDFGYGEFDTVTESFFFEVIDTNIPQANDHKCGIVALNGGLIYAFWFSKNNSEFHLYLRINPGNWAHVVTLSNPTDEVCGCELQNIAQIDMVPSTDGFELSSPFFVIKQNRTGANTSGLYCGVVSAGVMISTQPNTGNGFLEDMSDETEVNSDIFASFSLAVNPFTGAYYIAYFPREPDHASHALRVVRLDTATDPPVQLTDIPITGDNWVPSLTIDQVTGTLYVGFLGGVNGAWPLQVRTKWTRSKNGGSSWETILNSSTDQGEYYTVLGPHSFAFGGELSALFWVHFARRDTGGSVISQWRSVNSDDIIAGQFTVDETTPGNEVADCPVGQALGNSNIPGFFNPHGYPQYITSGKLYISVAPGKSGSLVPGDKIIGVRSRARGIFQGWSGSNTERILLTQVRPGPYGVPFLPGETIQKVGDPSITVTVAAAPLATTSSGVPADEET